MQRIGPYVLLSEIARGGMGVVYRARGPLGEVALKVLLDAKPDPRFLQEARSAARLNHPGVVRVHDLFEHEGRACLVMELVEGESLKQRLARDGPLPLDVALDLLRQLCDALEYAHAQGVIHRDLKPHNVLADSRGRVKLTDFGLGKVIDQSQHLTATGEIMGTPAYMPPEQATGDKRAMGVCSDVYGLGATLYALLTGQPPFRRAQGASLFQLLNAVLTRPPQPPSTLRADVPPWLDAVVLRCLAKDPADRYPSARALREALRDPPPPVAAPPHASAKLAKVLLLLGVLVGAGILAVRSPAGQEQGQPTRPQDPDGLPVAEVNAPGVDPEAPGVDPEAPGVDPGAPETDVLLGRARALASREPAAALDLIEPVLARDPTHLQALRLRSAVRHEVGDHAGELADLDHLVALTPQDPQVWLARGTTHAFHGDHAAGSADVHRALTLAPELGPEAEGLLRASLANWAAEAGRVRARGEPEAALASLERLLELAPDHPSALHQRALCRYDLNIDGALDDLSRAISLEPSCDALANRAILQAEAGDLDSAIVDLDRALSLGPTPQAERDLHSMRQTLASLLEPATSTAELLTRAKRRLDEGYQLAALPDVEEVLARDPAHAVARHLRAQVRVGRGLYEEALADLDLALRGAYADPSAYALRGAALHNLRQYRRALADFDRAVELAPKAGELYLSRAGVKAALADPIGAEADVRHARKVGLSPELDARAARVLARLRAAPR